jgi:hypothetical protein
MMAKSNVKLDYNELKKFKEQIEQISDPTEVDLFLTSCAKELGARLLAKVIKRTPVGQYPKGSGKVGGTLRRGWTGGKNANGSAYANSLPVNKVGNDYVIEIINPVEYASYVEFGHRTRNHKGWVEGHFMLTISEDEIRKSAPKILEKKLKKYLEGCFK